MKPQQWLDKWKKLDWGMDGFKWSPLVWNNEFLYLKVIWSKRSGFRLFLGHFYSWLCVMSKRWNIPWQAYKCEYRNSCWTCWLNLEFARGSQSEESWHEKRGAKTTCVREWKNWRAAPKPNTGSIRIILTYKSCKATLVESKNGEYGFES